MYCMIYVQLNSHPHPRYCIVLYIPVYCTVMPMTVPVGKCQSSDSSQPLGDVVTFQVTDNKYSNDYNSGHRMSMFVHYRQTLPFLYTWVKYLQSPIVQPFQFF